MSNRTSHYDQCPADEDPGAACVCEVLDDDLVQTETKMTLADMVRGAIKSGSLQARINAYANV